VEYSRTTGSLGDWHTLQQASVKSLDMPVGGTSDNEEIAILNLRTKSANRSPLPISFFPFRNASRTSVGVAPNQHAPPECSRRAGNCPLWQSNEVLVPGVKDK